MNEKLPYYIHAFTHLKRDNKNGGAPHKPILLLSIIRMFEKRIFTSNQIHILPELVASFKSNWTKLVVTNHHPIFALPFYHMNSEPFWKLVANVGCEKWVQSKSSMRSFGNLTTAVDFALVDEDLSKLLLEAESRDLLKINILEHYFPKTKSNYEEGNDDDLPSASILNETSEEYRRKIIDLKNKVDENSFQEEIFVRSGVFKREVSKIYDSTCCISGMRVDAVANVSMIDACHIVPFSETYDDSLTNGIALCPNLHRAFDRGLISISDDYTVLVKKNFIENNNSVFNISQFDKRKILLPKTLSHFPSLENLSLHRKRFDF